MKRVYVFILLLLSFLVGGCNKSNNEFNGYLKENDNLEIIKYDYTDKIIYEANSDFNLFSPMQQKKMVGMLILIILELKMIFSNSIKNDKSNLVVFYIIGSNFITNIETYFKK